VYPKWVLYHIYIRGSQIYIRGPYAPWTPPSGIIFVPEASTWPHLIVFLISLFNSSSFRDNRGSKLYIKGPCAPRMLPSGKTLTHPQLLAYTYITVKFQLHSSINEQLMECSPYNKFCIERSPKMGFWGDFSGRSKDSCWEITSVFRIALFQTSLVQIWCTMY